MHGGLSTGYGSGKKIQAALEESGPTVRAACESYRSLMVEYDLGEEAQADFKQYLSAYTAAGKVASNSGLELVLKHRGKRAWSRLHRRPEGKAFWAALCAELGNG